MAPTREIVNRTLNDFAHYTKMQLPGINIMSRSIRNWKAKTTLAPAIPKKRTDFVISERVAKFPNESPFLVYDSGVDDVNRILKFSS